MKKPVSTEVYGRLIFSKSLCVGMTTISSNLIAEQTSANRARSVVHKYNENVVEETPVLIVGGGIKLKQETGNKN